MFGTSAVWTLEASTLPELFKLIEKQDTSKDGYFYTTINQLEIISPRRDNESWKAIITAVIF